MMSGLLDQILKKLDEASKGALLKYATEHQDEVNFKFFSYGSNMNEEKFKDDMREKNAELFLTNPKRAVLQGYKRSLGNKSKRHGLAFTICASEDGNVEGICHDIPLDCLSAFLKKEGVLSKAPSYEIISVSVSSQNLPVLTLKGLKSSYIENCSCEDKLRALFYVCKSIEGAKRFQVDHQDMIEVRAKLRSSLSKERPKLSELVNMHFRARIDNDKAYMFWQD